MSETHTHIYTQPSQSSQSSSSSSSLTSKASTTTLILPRSQPTSKRNSACLQTPYTSEEDNFIIDIKPIDIQPTFLNINTAFTANNNNNINNNNNNNNTIPTTSASTSSTTSSTSSSTVSSSTFSAFASPTTTYATLSTKPDFGAFNIANYGHHQHTKHHGHHHGHHHHRHQHKSSEPLGHTGGTTGVSATAFGGLTGSGSSSSGYSSGSSGYSCCCSSSSGGGGGGGSSGFSVQGGFGGNGTVGAAAGGGTGGGLAAGAGVPSIQGCSSKYLCFSSPNGNPFGAQFQTKHPLPTASNIFNPGTINNNNNNNGNNIGYGNGSKTSYQSDIERSVDTLIYSGGCGCNNYVCGKTQQKLQQQQQPQLQVYQQQQIQIPRGQQGQYQNRLLFSNTGCVGQTNVGSMSDRHFFHDSQRSFTSPLFEDKQDGCSSDNSDGAADMSTTTSNTSTNSNTSNSTSNDVTIPNTTTPNTMKRSLPSSRSATRQKYNNNNSSSSKNEHKSNCEDVSSDEDYYDSSDEDSQSSDDEDFLSRERSRSRSPQPRKPANKPFNFHTMTNALTEFAPNSIINSRNTVGSATAIATMPMATMTVGALPSSSSSSSSSSTTTATTTLSGGRPLSARGRDPLDFKYRERMDSEGNTRLILSAAKGNLHAVNEFLSRKSWAPYVNERNFNGETALYRACLSRNFAVAELLLTRGGADPNIPTMEGNTPLHAAVAFSSSASHLRVIAALIERGADATAKDEEGDTPLHLAVRENADLVARCLVDLAGPHIIGCRNVDGETPLDLAEEFGNGEIAKWLREKYDAYREDLEDD